MKSKKIVLPQEIAEIPEKAFYSCMELEKIKVPGSVDKVGSEVFANCPVLKGVYFEGNSPKSLGVHIITENMFTSELATVYYKQSTEGWDSSYWEDYKLSDMDSEDDTVNKPEEGQGDNPQKDNSGASGGNPGGGSSHRPNTGGTGGASSGGSGGMGGGAIQTPGDTEDEKEDSDITLPKEDENEEDSIRLKPTYIKSVKHKKNKLIVLLKRIPSVSGYEVTYHRKKKGKKKTLTVSGWKNNIVILKRTERDKYRIKVRTYAEGNGKRYYSRYSKVYKIKI